jgi:head morphogeneis protein, SPP1 gp7 family
MDKKQLEDAFTALEEYRNKKSAEAYNKVQDIYDNADRQIKLLIFYYFSIMSQRGEVSFESAKRFLKSEELKTFKDNIKSYIEIAKQIKYPPKPSANLQMMMSRQNISVADALKTEVNYQIEYAFSTSYDILEKHISDIYKESYYKSAFEIQKSIGSGKLLPPPKDMNNLMELPWKIDDNSISDRIWKDKNKMMREIEREIAIDINTGRSPQISVENISQKLGVAKSNAKRLILTEEARFGSIAQMQSYKEMGIERYEILATLDLRTSKICQDMDGMIFFVKDYDVGVNAPPFHPRCRTVTIPYFDDDIKSTRAARDIESDKTHYISSDMTYDTWRQKYVNMDKSKESGYNININLQLFANKDLPKQTIKQMEKGIKSYKKQIDIHNDKINNPQKYVENWDKLDKLNQDGLIRHWNKEIETFNKNIHDNIEELKKRGVEID